MAEKTIRGPRGKKQMDSATSQPVADWLRDTASIRIDAKLASTSSILPEIHGQFSSLPFWQQVFTKS